MDIELSARRISALESKLASGNRRIAAYQNELKRQLPLDVVSRIQNCIYYTAAAQQARLQELDFLRTCSNSFESREVYV